MDLGLWARVTYFVCKFAERACNFLRVEVEPLRGTMFNQACGFLAH